MILVLRKIWQPVFRHKKCEVLGLRLSVSMEIFEVSLTRNLPEAVPHMASSFTEVELDEPAYLYLDLSI